MQKSEKITIAILVVALVFSLALLLKPEPSGEPQVIEPTGVIENSNPNLEAEPQNAQ